MKIRRLLINAKYHGGMNMKLGTHSLCPLNLPHNQRLENVMVNGNSMTIGWRIIETLLYLERRVFGTCTRTDHTFLLTTTGIQPVSCYVTSGQVLSRISTAFPPIPKSGQLFIHSHYWSPKLCQKNVKGCDPALQWALSAVRMLCFAI